MDKPASQRAFFGRRKGHPLRPRQAALFETLLPRLALDLTKPAPADLRALFADAGDGAAGNRLRRRRASDRAGAGQSATSASSAARRSSTAWPRRSSRSTRRKLANIRLHHGDASELLDWLPAGVARAHRSALSRSVAEAAALEAALRAGRQPGAAGAHSANRRRIPLRHRHCRATPAYALMRMLRSPDFVWTAERGRRLAQAVARILPARATRPRPSAKAARRRILFFGKYSPSFRARREREAMRNGPENQDRYRFGNREGSGSASRLRALRARRMRNEIYSPVPCRTCQKRTTRCAVAAVSRSKFSRAASIVVRSKAWGRAARR